MFVGLYSVILTVSAFLFALVGTGIAYAVLKRAQVMDTPNARSNHSLPTPRGGGIGIVVTALGFLYILGAPAFLLLALLVLAVISFIDDLRGLPARYRFLAQLLAVSGMLAFPYQGQLFDWLPRWLELPLLALAWLWFINLFNFMDGSDGLAGGEALTISLGIVLFALFAVIPPFVLHGSLILAATMAGFLLWNWHPARIFMGDVGSVPLGFLLGYLLLELAGEGYWIAALILPAVFLGDASFTLLRRLLKGERVYEAHSSHCYQRAIRGGMPHNQVAREVMEVNTVLIALAALSTTPVPAWQFGALAAAYLLVFGLLWRFARYTTDAHALTPAVVDSEDIVKP